ncbi:MAG: hypothetical protein KGV57_01010 [Fusobacterium sp.]|nr:hypothetical protein [Fusobacterium sp.]
MKKIKFSLIFLPLLIGVLIYLLYRSKNLFYFNFIHYLKVNDYVETARTIATFYRKFFPTWVIYSLPDGLWFFSAGAVFLLCRNKYVFHLFWYSILCVFILCLEYFQKIYGGHGTAIGTFDKNDLFAYSGAYILIVLISAILRKFDIKYKYKKSLLREFFENLFYTILILGIGVLANLF